MKRVVKIMIGLSLAISIWFMGIDNSIVSSTNKLLIPFVLLVLIGVMCLTYILWRVSKLEEHPQ